MMWPVLFKLQRCSHTDDAAAVRKIRTVKIQKRKKLFAAYVCLHAVTERKISLRSHRGPVKSLQSMNVHSCGLK